MPTIDTMTVDQYRELESRQRESSIADAQHAIAVLRASLDSPTPREPTNVHTSHEPTGVGRLPTRRSLRR